MGFVERTGGLGKRGGGGLGMCEQTDCRCAWIRVAVKSVVVCVCLLDCSGGFIPHSMFESQHPFNNTVHATYQIAR